MAHTSLNYLLKEKEGKKLVEGGIVLGHRKSLVAMASTRGDLEDHTHGADEPREDTPLLKAPDEETWKPPRAFL